MPIVQIMKTITRWNMLGTGHCACVACCPFKKKTNNDPTKFFTCMLGGTMACTQLFFMMSKALGEISESILRAHSIQECLPLTSRDLRLVTYIHDNICLVFLRWLGPIVRGHSRNMGPNKAPYFRNAPMHFMPCSALKDGLSRFQF